MIRGTTRVCPNFSGPIVSTMQLLLLLAVGLVGLVASQDTYSCPDGWMKEEDRTGCRCFLIGPDEAVTRCKKRQKDNKTDLAVTRSTADLVCAGHSGSWVAELDHPGWSTTVKLYKVYHVLLNPRYQLLAEVSPAGGHSPG